MNRQQRRARRPRDQYFPDLGIVVTWHRDGECAECRAHQEQERV